MRKNLLSIFFILISIAVYAQPANDDCAGIIDLGVAPLCPSGIYTNVDATASDIGNDNIPPCFNGGNVDRDVWFQFTTDGTITDYTITVTGVSDAMGSTPISNPQIEVYRGDLCGFDELASLQVCASANNGDAFVNTTTLGLDPNTLYFVRVNDYTASATPNSGTFEFCITEFIPDINICDGPGSTACSGTLYDCGGPDMDYSNGENYVYTVCPNEFHECILIDIVDFNIENNFDFLNIYAGDDINAPLLATLTGAGSGTDFQIQVSSPCVTFQFTSDGSAVGPGFELDWLCVSFPCSGSSEDSPEVISSIPFSDVESTCGEGSTIGDSPCPDDGFLNGPDYFYTYTSPGNECVSLEITNASPGTGVLVLDGPPSDPATNCIAQGPGGTIGSANFSNPGTYYIIVANGGGCTDFDLNMMVTDCNLSPALVDALCNPLNGCQAFDDDGNPIPTTFFLDVGFEDVPIVGGVNNGCYGGTGAGNFYWFTIQSQADGPFGFIVDGTNFASDIDLNVWGPFTESEVCDTPNDVIDFITNNQPIRSSWAGGADPTGLADIHPVTGLPVTDEYDCNGNNDDFVTTIPTLEGEVYVTLINDWGGQIVDGVIDVDWSPSNPSTLDPVPIEVVGNDTSICAGQSVMLEIPTGNYSIEWISNTSTLSCTDCPNPVATPNVTTIYQVFVDGVCISDTFDVKVSIFDVDAGPDFTVCFGEVVQLIAGSEYTNATYEWTGPNIGDLSCTDCPDPFLTTTTPGVFVYTATLNGPACTITDEVTVTVLTDPAPDFGLAADSILLCSGESANLGLATNPADLMYTWSSNPPGYSSMEPNPEIMPTNSAVYYVSVSSTFCPVTSLDSIVVLVGDSLPYDMSIMPSDTSVCAGSFVVLQSPTFEPLDFPGIVHQWTPDVGFQTPDDLYNMVIQAVETTTYIRTSTNGICSQMDTAVVAITPVSEIVISPQDQVICEGETIQLTASSDDITDFEWTPDNGSLSCIDCPDPIATPSGPGSFIYTASGEFENCPTDASTTVTVVANPAFNLTPIDSYCPGDPPIELNGMNDSNPSTTYTWSSDPLDPDLDTDAARPFVTPDVTTTYTLSISNGICDAIVEEITIFVPVDPTLTLDEGFTFCQNEMSTITLNASSNDDSGDFEWLELPSGDTGMGEIYTDTLINDTTTYYVTYTDGCGVSVTDSIEVNVIANLGLTILPPSADTTFAEGQEVDLTVVTNPGSPGATYDWSEVGGTQTISTIILEGDTLATYSVTITTVDGCEYVEEITYNIELADLDFPNAFTPNNDDVSDFFNMVKKGGIDVMQFRIYNRWGKVVYDNETPDTGWDGKQGDEDAPADVYFYYVIIRRPSGAEIPYQGDITLIR